VNAFFGKDKVSNDKLILSALVYEFFVHTSENHDAEQSVLLIRRQRSVKLGLDSLCCDRDILICTYDEERGTTMEASPSYLEFHSLTRFLHRSLAIKQGRPGDALGDSDKQCLHVFRLLDKILLGRDVDQGTNGKVSSIYWI
jgi:hypothetical protein